LKYIIYIFTISFFFALLATYLNTSRQPSEKDIVLTINKRHITRDEFNKRFANLYQSDRQGFINSLITKELMIQEAQKEGIDKTEAFRYSIQEYYEQSLVKQIMDKKISGLKVSVNDEEIGRHLAFQNSTVHLTIFRAENEANAKKRQFKEQVVSVAAAKDLSSDINDRLENLKSGELTSPLCSDTGCDVIRLDSIVFHPTPEPTVAARKELRMVLVERKKQKALDAWIAGLRAKSGVSVMIK